MESKKLKARSTSDKCNRRNCYHRESKQVNYKMMRPDCQSSTALKSIKLRCQCGKFVRTITMTLFIEYTQGRYVMAVTEPEINNIADSLGVGFSQESLHI